MSDVIERQTRRKTTLEVLSGVVPITSAVFFSGHFIGHWSIGSNVYLTSLTGLTLIAYFIWLKRRYPPSIAPWSTDDESKDAGDEDDDDGWWGPFTSLLFLIALVAIVVGGLLVAFFLPLVVILIFAMTNSGSGPVEVALAALATLGVSAVLEFAIVMPLCKLWNLSIDEEPRPRSDYCPKPPVAS